MIKCNDLYDYGYYIYQDTNYFKFSIDSILLAEFVKIKNNLEILDLCTGNIPIPMILTSKNKTLKITAIELQKEIYELGLKSIDKNSLTNINLLNMNIKDFHCDYKYDVVTCNPPYFKINERSELNENKIKRIARHEIESSLDDIVECAVKHLKDNGTFYMVHRTARLIDVINSIQNAKLGIRRITFIQTTNNSKCEFFLMEASKYKKSDPKINTLNICNLKTYKGLFKEAIK